LKNTVQNIALMPFALLYGLVTCIRNYFYDRGWLTSVKFDLPVISVGNLTVGGTGKTPHVEFILSLLQNTYNTAFLSRGYKRKTSGFLLATENDSSTTIGDEPFQIFRKFKKVKVAVDEKRVRGVFALLQAHSDIQAIVLDDAYQHRAISPGLNILLTDLSRLYTNDLLLPAGLLRESKSGRKRADIVIVTKCPPDLSENRMLEISSSLDLLPHQQLYFSMVEYGQIVPVFDAAETLQNLPALNGLSVLLVTGIVLPQPIVSHLKQNNATVQTMTFADHYHFKWNDYADIEQKFIHLPSEQKIILVTEKDAARIVSSADFPASLKKHLYYLPIRIGFLQNNQTQFIQKILSYVANHSGNS